MSVARVQAVAPDPGQVVAAALCLSEAMLATHEVRLRHRLPNSWHALAILLRLEPGRAWTAHSLVGFVSNPSYVLQALRLAGVVEGQISDHDRRTRGLVLTERGVEVVAELRRALGEGVA